MTKDKNKDCGNTQPTRSNPLKTIVNDCVGKKDNSNLAKFKNLGVKKDSK